MSVKDKMQEEAKHIRDVDAQLQEVDEHIKQAQKRQEQVLHPAPGLDLTSGKAEPNSAGPFGG